MQLASSPARSSLSGGRYGAASRVWSLLREFVRAEGENTIGSCDRSTVQLESDGRGAAQEDAKQGVVIGGDLRGAPAGSCGDEGAGTLGGELGEDGAPVLAVAGGGGPGRDLAKGERLEHPAIRVGQQEVEGAVPPGLLRDDEVDDVREDVGVGDRPFGPSAGQVCKSHGRSMAEMHVRCRPLSTGP